MQRVFTETGLRKLRREVEDLSKELADLQRKLGEAAEVGGNQWHDNNSYEELSNTVRQKGHLLAELHQTLRNSVLVEGGSSFNGEIGIGTKVAITYNDDQEEWVIAGFGESDFSNGVIAYNTPLAELLLGHRAGDEVQGEINEEKVFLKILSVVPFGS